VVIEDFIPRRIEFDTDNLPDPVLIKADACPPTHFAA